MYFYPHIENFYCERCFLFAARLYVRCPSDRIIPFKCYEERGKTRVNLHPHIQIVDDEDEQKDQHCHVCGDKLEFAEVRSKSLAALLAQVKLNKNKLL
jgi:hypothetical protein